MQNNNTKKLTSAVMPVALAASLAGNVLLATGGPSIAAADTLQRRGIVKACLSVGQRTSLRNILKSAVCPEFESRFNLGSNKCDADFIKSSWIFQDAEECPTSGWGAQATGTFPGTWAADIP